MTDYEAASLAIAEIAGWASVASAVASVLAFCTSIAVVILMWRGINAMVSANTARAAQAAEDRKAMQAQAAEDRKAMQAQTAQQAKDAAEDRKVMQAQAAEDRKAMQAQMAEDRKAMQAQMAEDRKAMQAQMAQAMADANARMSEDRKVTQGLMKALENQGTVLESSIRGNGSARLKDRRGHTPRQPE